MRDDLQSSCGPKHQRSTTGRGVRRLDFNQPTHKRVSTNCQLRAQPSPTKTDVFGVRMTVQPLPVMPRCSQKPADPYATLEDESLISTERKPLETADEPPLRASQEVRQSQTLFQKLLRSPQYHYY